ncbi:MAG: glucose-6-phosphate dehydrogenase [Pyrinomonadaceae bacterium]
MTQSSKVSNHTNHDRKAEPCIMVIFGAAGDLTKRKLLPALYNLAKQKSLPEEFAIVGFARDKISTEEFRQRVEDSVREFGTVKIEKSVLDWLTERVYYTLGDFSSDDSFKALKKTLDEVEDKHGTRGNYFYYMATPPGFFGEIVERLHKLKIAQNTDESWRRFVFEKPFSHDLESACALNVELRSILKESQIFRIDHYLGKETVQNILVFRFGNSIFEPIWNRNYIDHVQITVAEEVGVETRGGYFDSAGTLRDMIPNHIFQLITLTTMEPPVSFDGNAFRDEQAKILRAINPFTPEDVLHETVRGQYGEGEIGGKNVPAYRSEASVAPDSKTETFVAMKIQIDNWRWAGVPIYVRTGKRMATRHTDITIQFKQAPLMLFRETNVEKLTTNRLVISIQPDEGITLHFGAKIPGLNLEVGAVDMDFNYAEHFGVEPNTGYERLLFDCMVGDLTLFQRGDVTELAWQVMQPVLDVWAALPAREFPNYEAGSWGPDEADELLRREGRRWRNITAKTKKVHK